MSKPESGFKHVPVAAPRPDAAGFVDSLLRPGPGRRPRLVEYIVDPAVMRPVLKGMLGREWAEYGASRDSQRAYLDNFLEFWRRLGYDFVRFEIGLPFPESRIAAPDPTAGTGRREWADEHRGSICGWEDFERYPWPKVEEFDFFPYEYLAANLPEGMGLLASHAGGFFEHLSWILSIEGLSYALVDDPALVQAVSDRLGALLLSFSAHLLELPGLAALFPGDDMGFRSGPLVSPASLRRHVFPWHKRLAALAHGRGIPYFLHSCGNLVTVMPDLIDDVGIDGKHSYEDAILPAEDFQARFGPRIAVLGGVDVNVLAKGSEDDVRRRTRGLIEICGARGRYAIGSGNSIPSYVPARNYLAMVDEALDAGT